MEPTVFSDVTDDHVIAREEVRLVVVRIGKVCLIWI